MVAPIAVTPAAFSASTVYLKSSVQADSVAARGQSVSLNVSSDQTQVFVVSDPSGRARALGISIPGGVYGGAAADGSTTVKAMFLFVPGFPRATPGAAALALSQVEQLSCFKTLSATATSVLSTQPLDALLQSSDFASGLSACVDTYFRSPGFGVVSGLLGDAAITWQMPVNGIELERTGSPGRRVFVLRNYAYRAVDLYRRAFMADGNWSAPELVQSAIGGGSKMSWGSFATGILPSPTVFSDSRPFPYPANRAEYWVIGQSKLAISAPPAGIPSVSGAALWGTYWTYGIEPAIDLAFPFMTSSCIEGVMKAGWDLLKLGETLSASVNSVDEFSKALLNSTATLVDYAYQSGDGLAKCVDPSTVASKTIAGTILKAVGAGFAGFNYTGLLMSVTVSTATAASYDFELDSYALRGVSGSGQSGVVGQQLSAPLSVQLVDAAGGPVVGAKVYWGVASGGGSLSSSPTTTDVSGIARTSWTLGTTVGEQRATAEAYATSDIVTFTASALSASVTISGRITASSQPLSGVALSATGGPPAAMSGTDGTYLIAASTGYSGSVTPLKAGCTFAPASRSYANVTSSQTGQDFVATCGAGTGGLSLSVVGLPTNVAGNVTAAGPAGVSVNFTTSALQSGLPAGVYTITAAQVVAGGQTCVPNPASQVATIVAGATTSATVVYT
ncbi:MAG: hypothetical protein U9Q74_03715, partial [Gemmatimonadota bacterium]|nr:hypothetical protein [Gemmatimonadota bacterium]